ncbi:MAG: acyl-CoA synthetase [Rhizobium sp.]|nr:acyl-CoA synthetase [Rhizobium sp.]
MRGIASHSDVLAVERQGPPHALPPGTYDLLQASAARNPDAPALSFFRVAADFARPQTWTYRELLSEITRAANAFQSLGAARGSVIAIVLPNLPATHFATWGAQAAGIAFPVNYLLDPEAIANLVDAAGASILVTSVAADGMDLWSALEPRLARVPTLKHVLLVGPSDMGNACTHRDQATWARSRHGAQFTVHDFSRLLLNQPDARLPGAAKASPEDYSSFLCTGGTTGAPKIAMRRHGNEVANAWSTSQALGDVLGPGKSVFCGLPLFHANGLLVTGLLPFSVGAHVVVGTPHGYRSPGLIDNFWRIVEHHRINFFSAVPTVYGAVLQVPREGRKLDSLEYGLCGASPMPRELLLRFERETGVRVLEGYGLTEGTCVSSLNPPLGERRPGSIGLRLPGQSMKVVVMDADGRYVRDAIDGEPGHVVISGPNVFAGYLGSMGHRAAWLDCGDGREWLDTGDLAYRDPDGYFWLTGRAKDLIIRGGHNIDPAAIEQPLHAHEAVQLAAAVGRPDAHAGEVPVAYVQLRAGHAIDKAALLEYLGQTLGERATMPRDVILVDALPLTAVGKINKVELRRWQTEYVIRETLALASLSARSVRVHPDVDGLGAWAGIKLADPDSREAAAQALSWLTIRCDVA